MTTRIEQTLIYEEHSAEFWSQNLGSWATKMRVRADNYAILAAVLSALTGASVWATLAASTQVWAQVGVTVMAVATAVVALVPKLKGYADCSIKAAGLAGDYGRDLVALRFAHEHLRAGVPDAEREVREAIDAFLKTRAEKELLYPYPSELERCVQAERAELRIPTPDLFRR